MTEVRLPEQRCANSGCGLGGNHLSTTSGVYLNLFACCHTLHLRCCEVIDDRSATKGLAKFPIFPQGNCSFLHKSISIFFLEDDVLSLCIMLATRHRIVMNYATDC